MIDSTSPYLLPRGEQGGTDSSNPLISQSSIFGVSNCYFIKIRKDTFIALRKNSKGFRSYILDMDKKIK